MSSKIEQIIDEIEDYLDGCKYAALSNKNILVNKEEIGELVAELRTKTPEEIKRYQKIISNKEAIMQDAQQKAEVIIGQAQEQAKIMVSEHPITQQAMLEADAIRAEAEAQAQATIDDATTEANSIRLSAMKYTDDLLRNIESVLTNSVDTTRARYENLLSCLQSYLDVVVANRASLYPAEQPAAEPAPAEEPTAEPAPAPAEEPAVEAVRVEEPKQEEKEEDDSDEDDLDDEELEEIDV